ncbi:hypothetical protein JQX13_42850 [Archangium violaceum]|uniref:DUF6484 domain-containing protein n=1 Tax=Archangium violaceum TaxID=83451 RepID=UPI00193B9CE7|nr:DUF6484 domain-containing protein [Archangium violaceum]QRK06742.1 hypothetical protein JQX13_42850 [Archangium violaceum]
MTKTEEQHGAEQVWDAREGYVAGTDGEGRPVVDFEGNPAGPRVALTTVPMAGAALEAAVTSRQRVQLRFQDGDIRRPVIVGLSHETRQGDVPRRLHGAGGTRLEVLEDEDGVTLRVGKASLRLMQDGRVFLKGTYVETCAEGLNRIKGGTVDIG